MSLINNYIYNKSWLFCSKEFAQRPEFHNIMTFIDVQPTPIDFTTLQSLLFNQEMLHQNVASHSSFVVPSPLTTADPNPTRPHHLPILLKNSMGLAILLGTPSLTCGTITIIKE